MPKQKSSPASTTHTPTEVPNFKRILDSNDTSDNLGYFCGRLAVFSDSDKTLFLTLDNIALIKKWVKLHNQAKNITMFMIPTMKLGFEASNHLLHSILNNQSIPIEGRFLLWRTFAYNKTCNDIEPDLYNHIFKLLKEARVQNNLEFIRQLQRFVRLDFLIPRASLNLDHYIHPGYEVKTSLTGVSLRKKGDFDEQAKAFWIEVNRMQMVDYPSNSFKQFIEGLFNQEERQQLPAYAIAKAWHKRLTGGRSLEEQADVLKFILDNTTTHFAFEKLFRTQESDGFYQSVRGKIDSAFLKKRETRDMYGELTTDYIGLDETSLTSRVDTIMQECEARRVSEQQTFRQWFFELMSEPSRRNILGTAHCQSIFNQILTDTQKDEIIRQLAFSNSQHDETLLVQLFEAMDIRNGIDLSNILDRYDDQTADQLLKKPLPKIQEVLQQEFGIETLAFEKANNAIIATAVQTTEEEQDFPIAVVSWNTSPYQLAEVVTVLGDAEVVTVLGDSDFPQASAPPLEEKVNDLFSQASAPPQVKDAPLQASASAIPDYMRDDYVATLSAEAETESQHTPAFEEKANIEVKSDASAEAVKQETSEAQSRNATQEVSVKSLIRIWLAVQPQNYERLEALLAQKFLDAFAQAITSYRDFHQNSKNPLGRSFINMLNPRDVNGQTTAFSNIQAQVRANYDTLNLATVSEILRQLAVEKSKDTTVSAHSLFSFVMEKVTSEGLHRCLPDGSRKTYGNAHDIRSELQRRNFLNWLGSFPEPAQPSAPLESGKSSFTKG